MVEEYDLTRSYEKTNLGVTYRNSNDGAAFFSRGEPLRDRVERLKREWSGCNQCGKTEKPAKVYSRRLVETPCLFVMDGIFCSFECSKRFHASPMERRQKELPWSHVTKCTLANQLATGSYMPPEPPLQGQRVKIADLIDGKGRSSDGDEEDASDFILDSYRKLFATIEKLQDSIDSALKLVNKKEEPEFVQWTEDFEHWTQQISKMNGKAFKQELLGHHERIVVMCKEKKTQHLEEIQVVMRELIATIPFQSPNKEKKRGKCVIAFDGGGMRGIVTLVILTHLLKELRLLVGRNDAQLKEFFDMAIGSSTGSLIACASFLQGLPIEKSFEMYDEVGKLIFADTNRFAGVNPIANMMVKYNDWPLTSFLMAESNMERLDQYPLRYEESGKRGCKTRVIITAVDITTRDTKLVLFRNYEPSTPEAMAERFPGTSHAYLFEALRASTAAPTFFHPYSRGFAPIIAPHTSMNMSWNWRGYSHYMQSKEPTLQPDKNKPVFTHRSIILTVKPEDEGIMAKDEYLNSGTILSDAGVGANNPSLLAILESERVWPEERAAVFVSIGTGKAPALAHKTWTTSIQRPLESPLLFSGDGPKVSQMMRDLISITLAEPATESEDTTALAECAVKRFASFIRLNPPLEKQTELDRADKETFSTLVKTTELWCTSLAGSMLIRRCAREVLQQ